MFYIKKNTFFNFIGYNFLYNTNINLKKIWSKNKFISKPKFKLKGKLNVNYTFLKLKNIKKKLKIFIKYTRKKKIIITRFNIKYTYISFLIKYY